MLNKQVDIKKYEKRYVASDFLPQVGIAGSYNYMHGIKFNNAGYLLNGTNYEVLLSVKIPIFNWGEGAKKVKAAERDMDISRLSRDDAYDKMTLELQNRIDGYDEALLEVKMTRHALKQSEENLRMSRNNYDVGMETLSDYLQAQSIWQNAKAEYISARTNLEISKVEYLKAAGKL
jgi:outer membrane protein TolC